MELNITKLWQNPDGFTPRYYFASAAEIGQDAGAITWADALDRAEIDPLLSTEEEFDAMRAFVRSSGGWDNEEVAAMSDQSLNALLVQWIAGDIREGAEETGRLFIGTDGNIYFYLGE